LQVGRSVGSILHFVAGTSILVVGGFSQPLAQVYRPAQADGEAHSRQAVEKRRVPKTGTIRAELPSSN
jgi:hypothetical protein